MRKKKYILATPLSLLSLTVLSGAFLMSSFVSADDSVVDNININVPISCSMEGTGMTSHTDNIVNGTYKADIGTTTLKAFCNDSNGFAIYAIGYTDNEYGKNVLTSSTLGSTYDIETGTATSGDTSNWAMKLSTISSPTPVYPITLDNSFGSYHAVPAEYTKVAHRDSSTDIGTNAEGSTLTTTYAAFMSQTQAAGTYIGQVRYTLVHPSDKTAPTPPIPPTSCTTPVPNLTYMQDLNSSNKSSVLASMTEDSQYYLADSRDNKTYCVSKLKDGNIWMTQNLDHDIVTNGTVIYDNTTTDLGWNNSTNSYNTASWTPIRPTTQTNTWCEGGSYTKYGTCYNYTPESYDPGNLYWSGIIEDENPTSTGNSHYHLGNYYNWSAAVATNDSSVYGEDENTDQSICPAGWTLPKSGPHTSNGSFQYLLEQYGWDNSQYTTNSYVWDSPMYFANGDSWRPTGFSADFGGVGDYWSSTAMPIYDAYNLYIDVYNDPDENYSWFIIPDSVSTNSGAFPIRCMTR